MKQKGVEILMETKGIELYADGNRRVIGIRAVDQVGKKTLAIKAIEASYWPPVISSGTRRCD